MSTQQLECPAATRRPVTRRLAAARQGCQRQCAPAPHQLLRAVVLQVASGCAATAGTAPSGVGVAQLQVVWCWVCFAVRGVDRCHCVGLHRTALLFVVQLQQPRVCPADQRRASPLSMPAPECWSDCCCCCLCWILSGAQGPRRLPPSSPASCSTTSAGTQPSAPLRCWPQRQSTFPPCLIRALGSTTLLHSRPIELSGRSS
jgi:hypothetical protein